MQRDWDGWMKRADIILAKQISGTYQEASEAFQFATSMLAALYGCESPQSRALRSNAESISQETKGFVGPEMRLILLARGAIENAKREAEAGLIVNARALIAGELLAELVRLAKDVLGERTDEATNVASVLAASGSEALIRRMGEEFAGVTDRRNWKMSYRR